MTRFNILKSQISHPNLKNHTTVFNAEREDIGLLMRPFFYMRLKYILAFFISILFLIGSEYIFLIEFSQAQQKQVLILSAIAALVSITLIFLTINRSREDPR